MMQMQKIKRLCLAYGKFRIVNGKNQWLGHNAALYAVPGDMHIDAGMLPVMFDLTDKQVMDNAWNTTTETAAEFVGFRLCDSADDDVLLHKLPASVTMGGNSLDVFYSGDGEIALLADSALFAPIGKFTDAQYYARRRTAGWAIAVKNGYALIAYILPWSIAGEAMSDIVLRLRDVLGVVIAGAAAHTTTRPAETSTDILADLKAAYGEGAEVDEETGEVMG
jgi:hypothetical protein